MNKVYFATTNENKIKEAMEILQIEIEGCGIEIDEIQSLNPVEVATKKAKAYFSALGKPIFVEDVSLTFVALNGLPGTYINDFSKALGNKGLINLLQNEQNRQAIAQTTIVYIDTNAQEHVFEGVVEGEITNQVLGYQGFGWDPIFIPNGENRTFAQMTSEEKHKYSMRGIALKKFADFLQTRNQI